MENVTVIQLVKNMIGVNDFYVKKWSSDNVTYKLYRVHKETPKYVLLSNVDRIEMEVRNSIVNVTFWVK